MAKEHEAYTEQEMNEMLTAAAEFLPEHCQIMVKKRFVPGIGMEENRASIWREGNTKRLVGYIGSIPLRIFTPDDGAPYGVIQELVELGWTVQ